MDGSTHGVLGAPPLAVPVGNLGDFCNPLFIRVVVIFCDPVLVGMATKPLHHCLFDGGPNLLVLASGFAFSNSLLVNLLVAPPMCVGTSPLFERIQTARSMP